MYHYLPFSSREISTAVLFLAVLLPSALWRTDANATWLLSRSTVIGGTSYSGESFIY